MRWRDFVSGRERVERHLDAERRFRFEEKARKYVARGMDPAEARRQARLEFGGVGQINDECRNQWPARSFDRLRLDLAYAFRTADRKPRFAALVILTLVLGIGANTAVFSIFDVVLLRPLPFQDAGRLIAIWESEPRKLDSTGIWNSYRDLLSWRRGSRTVQEFAAYCWVDANPVLRGRGTRAKCLRSR